MLCAGYPTHSIDIQRLLGIWVRAFGFGFGFGRGRGHSLSRPQRRRSVRGGVRLERRAQLVALRGAGADRS
eukprot:6720472-Prymnesium_polylepis.1